MRVSLVRSLPTQRMNNKPFKNRTLCSHSKNFFSKKFNFFQNPGHLLPACLYYKCKRHGDAPKTTVATAQNQSNEKTTNQNKKRK